MNVLLVPTLALDLSLLDRLAESIDYPIQHKIIVQNGRRYALDKWGRRHPGWKVLDQKRNLGVAASWNLAAELCPHERAWLICNDDIAFPPGVLEQFCEFGDANAATHWALRLNDSSPYYCFIHTRRNIEDFGTFDENFWPAYYEDVDYNVRIRKVGGQFKNCFPGQGQVMHGKPRCGGVDYAAMLQGSGLFNRMYWRSKWGDNNYEQARYKTPFNDPKASIGHWVLDENRRSHLEALFTQFMEFNPSIYD